MASSRVFVKGIPPTINEADFRRHFSAQHSTTDVRIFPNRRIGYVGYRTPEDAASAVKYFNKTFMKMSKLAVELARPISNAEEKYLTPTFRAQQNEKSYDQHESIETSRKRKRAPNLPNKVDPKLEEYLNISKNQAFQGLATHNGGNDSPNNADVNGQEIPPAFPSVASGKDDDEYEDLASSKKSKSGIGRSEDVEMLEIDQIGTEPTRQESKVQDSGGGPPEGGAATGTDHEEHIGNDKKAVSDSDWLRSKTSRLLGLLDEREEQSMQSKDVSATEKIVTKSSDLPTQPRRLSVTSLRDDAATLAGPKNSSQVKETNSQPTMAPTATADEDVISKNGRLFLRNLPFEATEDSLRDHFSQFGMLEEVHVPIDNRTGRSKGTAFLQFVTPDAAVEAYRACDGQTFQGRLLHIIPAATKRTSKIDEYELSKLPLKKQNQIRRRMDASKASFNWNSLYMNADAVMSSVSDRLGVDKATLLDPTSADAAVKQALAETHVINESKTYFAKNGVDLEAFKRSTKGDTAILVKNFSFGTKADELKRLFEEHGEVVRMLMPPSGIIAIVEFATPTQARAAFASLAYRKLKDSVLFLEKAPKDLFTVAAPTHEAGKTVVSAPSKATELLQSQEDVQGIDTTTLFVRNLNFSTTSARLAEAFKPLDGFLAARVKLKTDPSKPNKQLSSHPVA